MRAPCFITFLLGAIMLGEAATTRRLGLMIGVNDGGRNRIRLKYADSDARSFAISMQELGGVDPEDLILAEDVDSSGLAGALDLLAARAAAARRDGRRIEAVIYYSGHADEQGLLLRGQRFGFREFRGKVDRVPADVRIAIVDACASGALTKVKGGQPLPTFLSDQSNQATGYAFLTGSADNEAAQGRFFIRDSEDRLAAEIQKIAGHPAVVALEPGPYKTRWHQAAGTYEQGFTLTKGSDFRLEPGQNWRRVSAENAVARGNVPPDADDREKSSRFQLLNNDVEDDFRGTQMSFIFNRGQGYFEGQQPAGVVNRADAEFHGTQVAIALNYAGGPLQGGQMAFGFNWAGGALKGIQLSGGMNYANSMADGIQVTGIFNLARGEGRGVQGATLLNVVTGSLVGGQAAFVNTVGGDLHGGHFSVVANVVRGDLQGAQISCFNFTGGAVEGTKSDSSTLPNPIARARLWESSILLATEYGGATLGLTNRVSRIWVWYLERGM